ncbi:MAG: hypothetical protein CL979_00825 [Euryarchaeota archaeon]|nr:hypothetical protein [Euryarchaeota archaeon]
MGRPQDEQAQATKGKVTSKASTPLPVLRAMEHEERRHQKRDILHILRSNRQMTKANIRTPGSLDATVMRNRTGCIWHRE